MKRKETKKIIDWIDFLKAIGIFLVVIGHSFCPLGIRKFIYAFHMPLFFLIGGLTFKPDKYNNLKEVVIDKAKKLLIPYLFINIFTLPIVYVRYVHLYHQSFDLVYFLKGLIYAQPDYLPIVNGPTWFIPTLFLCEIVLYIAYKVFNRDKKSLFLFSLLLISIGYSESITSNEIFMPWHLNSVPVACSFTIIGYLFINYWSKTLFEYSDNHKFKTLLISILFLIVGGIIAVFLNGNVYFGGNKYKSIIYTMLACYLLIFGFVLLVKNIKKSKLLSFIGRNSIIILALHSPIIKFISYYYPDFNVPSVKSLFIGCLLFIVLLPLTFIVEKYFPFVVGNLKKYNKTHKAIIGVSMVLILVVLFILQSRQV